MPIEHSPSKKDVNTSNTQLIDLQTPADMSNDQQNANIPPFEPSALPLQPVIGAATLAKLPPFWKENPILWFIQVEAAFTLARITNDDTKFRYVILNLDSTTLPFVSDIVANPPPHDKYQALKDRIIRSFDETAESKLRKLIRGHEIGDDKPSNYLQRLRNLAGGQCNDSVLRTLFFEQLPESVRSVLAISEVADLSVLASQADKIYEITKPTINALTYVKPSSSSQTTPKDLIDDLSKRLDALTKELRNQRRQRSRSRQAHSPRDKSKSKERDQEENAMCWYHRQFGERAKKCQQPCEYQTKNKTEN